MGKDRERPEFYNEVINSLKRMSELDTNLWNNITNLNSKITYNMQVQKYHITPKIESLYRNVEWSELYKNVQAI